jgi:hypothetical protein
MIIITVHSLDWPLYGKTHEFKYRGNIELSIGEFLWVEYNVQDGDWDFRGLDAFFPEDIISIKGADNV